MPGPTLFRQFYDWDATAYTFSGAMKGHSGAINALSFNTSGALLASGGDDEQVRIWDMKSLRQCQNLVHPQGRWGQVTCLQFIHLDSSAADWLCFGTGRGMVALYRKSRRAAEFVESWSMAMFPAGDSVEAFVFDPSHQRLAASSHYGHIKMLIYERGNFVEVWSDELPDAIPRGLLFSDNGRFLTIFTLETGTIICRDAETSMIISTRNLKTAIGYVSQCRATGDYLVDNMHDGFDLYTYAASRPGPARTFRIATSRMYVKAGVFCENGKAIACGSDHGRLYVFEIGDERAAVQGLYHGRKQDLIQAVEAKTTNGFHIIVSGSSGGDFDIYIWKKSTKVSVFPEKRQLLETLVAMNAIFLVVLLWLTNDAWAWGEGLKGVYRNLSARKLEPYMAVRGHGHGLPPDASPWAGKAEPSPLTSLAQAQKIFGDPDDGDALSRQRPLIDHHHLKMPPAMSRKNSQPESTEQ